MATYIPGVQGYYPEFEPFVPDYKFLSGVLDQRTDRYNTNYKALNDLYSKVVYADLTRDDSIEMRDQYANLLAPKLEQVASMDLSIQQNVDAAKALFQPFYDNDLIVKDLIATQQYKKELGYANSLLESDDKKTREKYWQTGVEALQYQMQDFKQADPGKALKMGLPKYVPDADLFQMSLDVLKESGLSVEQERLDPSGYWIIKQKNGSIVTPIAFETVKRTLLDDPRVINAYYTDAYVKSRKFAEDGMAQGQFTTVDEGRTVWANNMIADIQAKTLRQNEKTKDKVKETEDVKNNWEQYQRQYGIVAGSDEDLAMIEALAKYDAEKAKLRSQEDILQESQDPSPSDETLISKAYNMLMSYNISDDMMAAAQKYSMTDASLTFKSNPYKEMELKFAHENALELAKHKYKLAEQDAKHKLDKELYDYENRFKVGLSDIFNRAFGGNEKTSLFDKDGDGEPDTDANVVNFNDAATKSAIADVNKMQIDNIKAAHRVIEDLKGKDGKQSMITVDTKDGKKTMDMDQFSKVMSDPGNAVYLANTYRDYRQKLEFADKVNPTLYQNDGGKTWQNLWNGFTKTDTRAAAVVAGINEGSSVYASNLAAVKQTEYGKPLVEMDKKGVPSIVTSPLKKQLENQETLIDADASRRNALYLTGMVSPVNGGTQSRLLTKEEYRQEFIKKYTAGQMKGVEIPKPKGSFYGMGPSATDVLSASAVNYQDPSQRTQRDPTVLTIGDVADKHYDAQMTILNKTLNGAITPTRTADGKETGAFKTFGFEQWMRGMSTDEMTVGNISTFPMYSQFVDPTQLDENSYNALKDFATQYANTPNAVVVKGDLTGTDETPTESEATTKDILGVFMNDVQAAYTNPEAYKSSAPRFKLTYAPIYGAPSGDRQNAAYLLELDPDYVKSKFAGASDESKTYISNNEVGEYSKMTMLFPRQVDMNPKNSDQYAFSAVQAEIQKSPEAKYTYSIPKGGYMSVYKDGNNWMYSVNTFAYDPKTGNFVPQDYVTSSVLTNQNGQPATRGQVDPLVGGIQEVLKAKAQLNINTENLYKRNQKNK